MSTFTRRELLRLSGVSLASGLVLAACGKQAGVVDDEAIAVLGQSQTLTPLAEAEVTDAVFFALLPRLNTTRSKPTPPHLTSVF